MLSLQELIEKGYITNIKSESTHIGDGYEITINLKRSSVYNLVLSVGIDETLDDAVELINCMIDSVEKMKKKNPDNPNARLKNLFSIDKESERETFEEEE